VVKPDPKKKGGQDARNTPYPPFVSEASAFKRTFVLDAST
jgi:hypothetical protein